MASRRCRQCAIAAGSHYWDRVVQIGLQGATYEFGLPSALGSLAAHGETLDFYYFKRLPTEHLDASLAMVLG